MIYDLSLIIYIRFYIMYILHILYILHLAPNGTHTYIFFNCLLPIFALWNFMIDSLHETDSLKGNLVY